VGSGASRVAICDRAPAFFSLAIQRKKPIACYIATHEILSRLERALSE
jgi:hypothetical protein